MQKGTIVYIGGFELPDKNAAAHRVISNAKIFSELGYRVAFIGVDKDAPEEFQGSPIKSSINGYEVWNFSYPKTNKQWIRYLTEAKSTIDLLKNYNDLKVVILYNYQSIPFIKIKNYCGKNNIRIIADCTEWYDFTSRGTIHKLIKGFDTFLRMRILQKRVDGLILISSYLKKYYGNVPKSVLIPPLVDKNEEKWKKEGNDLLKDKINMVYAGSPSLNKDKINHVINALYNLRNYSFEYTFYIIGLNKKEFLSSYPELTVKIQEIKDNIKFLGRLSHLDSLRYVKNADYTIFIRENSRMTKAGFPTKFVESISAGTPTVTTNTSDLYNYINDGKNGILIKLIDINEIELTLKNILQCELDDVRKRKNLVQSDIFDFHRYKRDFEEFFQDI